MQRFVHPRPAGYKEPLQLACYAWRAAVMCEEAGRGLFRAR